MTAGESRKMDDMFHKAVEDLLTFECGFVDDPADPGRATNHGISQRSYPDLNIRGLTRDEAVKIYYRDWWMKYSYWRVRNPEVAAKLLVLAVNMGPRPAAVLLQKAICMTGVPVSVDGVVGPETAGAVNSHTCPRWLLDRYRVEAARYYSTLGRDRYERGWIRRAVT